MSTVEGFQQLELRLKKEKTLEVTNLGLRATYSRKGQ